MATAFPKIRWLLLLLTFVGALLSLLLLYEHEQIALGVKASLSVCDISARFNCQSVISSSWSSIFGIPLAVWGLFFYCFAMAAIWARLHDSDQRLAVDAFLLTLFTIATVFSVALFLVSHFAIGAICPLCLSLYVVNFLGMLLLYRVLGDGGIRAAYKAVKDLLNSPTFREFRVEAPVGKFSIVSLIKVLVLSAVLTLLSAVAIKLFVAQTNVVVTRKVMRDWPREGRLTVVKTKAGGNADLYKGSRTARIQIVEFADLQCPFCRQFYLELDELVKKYPGRVQIVFKNYPLDSSCNINMPAPMHLEACNMAHGFRCLAEQDLFWPAMDILASDLFLDQEKDTREAGVEVADDSSEMGKVLAQIDLDRDAWNECMASGRYWDKIKEDIAQAEKLGITGTPDVWVNGRRFANLTNRGLGRLVREIMVQRQAE